MLVLRSIPFPFSSRTSKAPSDLQQMHFLPISCCHSQQWQQDKKIPRSAAIDSDYGDFALMIADILLPKNYGLLYY